MESENNGKDMSVLGGEPAGSRWTPTKEQIDLLEDLCRKGVKTPSAEQIQQITSKLKVFGHVEGKNVFYWFQNHKARQRQKQKQKQENVALFNRFMLHRTTPPPHPPYFAAYYPNVSCNPPLLYVPPPPPPPSKLGYRQCYPNIPISSGYCHNKRRRPLLPDAINNTLYTKPYNVIPIQEPTIYQEQNKSIQNDVNVKEFYNRSKDQETLNLFPLEPSGNLQERRVSISIPSTSTHISASFDTNYNNGSGNFGHDRPLIDFFCMDARCKST